jgi:hypothetical protein
MWTALRLVSVWIGYSSYFFSWKQQCCHAHPLMIFLSIISTVLSTWLLNNEKNHLFPSSHFRWNRMYATLQSVSSVYTLISWLQAAVAVFFGPRHNTKPHIDVNAGCLCVSYCLFIVPVNRTFGTGAEICLSEIPARTNMRRRSCLK